MNAMQLAQSLASNPFLRFAKLGTVNKNNSERLRLGFDGFLKNHIGTLHAGALFTAAQADAQAHLEQLIVAEDARYTITAYSSQIAYKRPAKGPVWVNTQIEHLDIPQGTARTRSTINNEADEPLAELHIQFTFARGT